MSRETFDVREFKEWVNSVLARDDNEHLNPSVRTGLYTALEYVLEKTDNYHGFNYLEWINGGYDEWIDNNNLHDSIISEFAKKYPEHYNLSQDTYKYIPDKSKRLYY